MTIRPKSFLLILSALVFVILAILVIFSDFSSSNLIKKFESVSGQKVVQTESETKVIDQSTTNSEELFLNITSPQDNSVVSNPILTIKGTTVNNAEIFINDKETKSKADGTFSTTVTLEEGENILTIVMNDSLGNYIEKELAVSLESF